MASEFIVGKGEGMTNEASGGGGVGVGMETDVGVVDGIRWGMGVMDGRAGSVGVVEGRGRAVGVGVVAMPGVKAAAATGAAICICGLIVQPISADVIRHITNRVNPIWYAAQWGRAKCLGRVGFAFGGETGARCQAHCSAVQVRGF